MEIESMSRDELINSKNKIDFYLTTKFPKNNNDPICYELLQKFLMEKVGISYPPFEVLKKHNKKQAKQLVHTLENWEKWANNLFQKNSVSIKQKHFIRLSILFIVSVLCIYFKKYNIPIYLKSLAQMHENTFQEIIAKEFPGYSQKMLVNMITNKKYGKDILK